MNELRYKEIVKTCNVLTEKLSHVRDQVAKLSLEVVPHGKGKKPNGDYTLKRLSKDINVSVGALKEWRAQYLAVTKHVPKRKRIKKDTNVIKEVIKEIGHHAPKKVVVETYDEIVKKKKTKTSDFKIRSALDYLRRANYVIENDYETTLHKLTKKDLKSLEDYLSRSLKLVNAALKRKR
jgi:hypothetical protein